MADPVTDMGDLDHTEQCGVAPCSEGCCCLAHPCDCGVEDRLRAKVVALTEERDAQQRRAKAAEYIATRLRDWAYDEACAEDRRSGHTPAAKAMLPWESVVGPSGATGEEG
jgi:hypothetical protein